MKLACPYPVGHEADTRTTLTAQSLFHIRPMFTHTQIIGIGKVSMHTNTCMMLVIPAVNSNHSGL